MAHLGAQKAARDAMRHRLNDCIAFVKIKRNSVTGGKLPVIEATKEGDVMILYGLKTCDTCRKALKSLENAESCDVRTEGVPQDVMTAALAQFGEALLNRKSTTWRGLSESERTQAPEVLLAEHPTLMKRPLIEAQGRLYLGWGGDTQTALLG